MNRKAKFLFLTVVIALAILITVISIHSISAQNWSDYLTLEYNTDYCLSECEAIFTIKNPAPVAISLGNNDVRIWHEVAKGPGLIGNIEIYKEEIVSYEVNVPEYGTCSYTDGNGSLVEYSCQTGSHYETRTRNEFVPFDFTGKIIKEFLTDKENLIFIWLGLITLLIIYQIFSNRRKK